MQVWGKTRGEGSESPPFLPTLGTRHMGKQNSKHAYHVGTSGKVLVCIEKPSACGVCMNSSDAFAWDQHA